METDDFREKIVLYKKGELDWLDLAPDLDRALIQKQGKITSLGLPGARVSEIIRAYRLIKAQRPDFLKTRPSKNIVRPWKVVYLLSISRTTPESPEKEQEFQELIDRVLSDEIGEKELRLRASKGKVSKKDTEPSKASKTEDPSPSEIEGSILTGLESSLFLLEFVLDRAVEKISEPQLRAILGDRCFQLANRLNCIADGEFSKRWKQRREFKI